MLYNKGPTPEKVLETDFSVQYIRCSTQNRILMKVFIMEAFLAIRFMGRDRSDLSADGTPTIQ
jgi:hypothetical protein